MPPREAWAAWLGEAPAEEEALAGMLSGALTPELRIWPVGARVGRVAENDAGLLEPVPGGAPGVAVP